MLDLLVTEGRPHAAGVAVLSICAGWSGIESFERQREWQPTNGMEYCAVSDWEGVFNHTIRDTVVVCNSPSQMENRKNRMHLSTSQNPSDQRISGK